MNSYCRHWKSWFARLRFSLLFHMKDGPEKLILWNPDPCDLYAVFPSTISVAVSHYDTQTENDLLNDAWNTLNLCICSCLEYGWLNHSENIASFDLQSTEVVSHYCRVSAWQATVWWPVVMLNLVHIQRRLFTLGCLPNVSYIFLRHSLGDSSVHGFLEGEVSG